MQSGFDTASQRLQNASISSRARSASPVRKGTARPTVPAERRSDHEVRDRADPSLSGHLAGMVQPGSEAAPAQPEGLQQARALQFGSGFAAVQSGLVRESLQHMVEDSHAIVEISLEAVHDASKAVAGTAEARREGSLKHPRRLRSRRVCNLADPQHRLRRRPRARGDRARLGQH